MIKYNGPQYTYLTIIALAVQKKVNIVKKLFFLMALTVIRHEPVVANLPQFIYWVYQKIVIVSGNMTKRLYTE